MEKFRKETRVKKREGLEKKGRIGEVRQRGEIREEEGEGGEEERTGFYLFTSASLFFPSFFLCFPLFPTSSFFPSFFLNFPTFSLYPLLIVDPLADIFSLFFQWPIFFPLPSSGIG